MAENLSSRAGVVSREGHQIGGLAGLGVAKMREGGATGCSPLTAAAYLRATLLRTTVSAETGLLKREAVLPLQRYRLLGRESLDLVFRLEVELIEHLEP